MIIYLDEAIVPQTGNTWINLAGGLLLARLGQRLVNNMRSEVIHPPSTKGSTSTLSFC